MRIILIAFLLLYVVSPVDLIPDFFKPLGLLDDGLALWVIYWILTNKRFKPFSSQGQKPPPSDADSSEPHSQKKQSAWEILGIPENATLEEIKTAHRQRSQEYHPDKVQHLGKDLRELADRKFREIQKAFETLQKGF